MLTANGEILVINELLKMLDNDHPSLTRMTDEQADYMRDELEKKLVEFEAQLKSGDRD